MPVRDVAIGRTTCVLGAQGNVRCAAADGKFEDVPLSAPAEVLAAGEGGTCALLKTGNVACWGCGSWETPRDQAAFEPARVAELPLPSMIDVSVGRDVACGVTLAGGVVCWGAQDVRRVLIMNRTGAEICHGDGVDVLPRPPSPTVQVALSSDARSAAVWLLGRDRRVRVREELPQQELQGSRNSIPRRWNPHFVELAHKGAAVRQLGTGGDLESHFFPRGNGCVLHVLGDVTCEFGFPEGWPKNHRWTTAYKHGCALRSDGPIVCWGYDRFGQAPEELRLPTPPTELAVGKDHDCALLGDGRVACWGANADGQFGPPLTPCKPGCSYRYCDALPHVVPDLGDVVHVRAGGATTCAVTRDGKVLCWDAIVDVWNECDVYYE
jgi:hypothetical protein